MLARHLYLALAGLAHLGYAQDVLFPHMHGLKYSELDQAVKLGLTTHVCKDEAEWYGMTTADFAKYKAIVIPDCMCNTSLTTIKFLDDTKKIWSPAVTGNMVIIGTDPSFHAKWFNLPGAYAMMRDSISLVSTGKNGTGMYFSLSCYYQSTAVPMTIQSLSEIGNFQVRGNLSHPCLNNAHLVAKSSVMTTLNDSIASNWNCSVHEAFSEYPSAGSGSFEALAIALNATGLGQRSFADNTTGIPYIIARGATPLGCGNNITEPAYNEECDNGPANGTPGDLCSSSCKCLHGVITPGTCRSNITSSSSSSTYSSTQFSNSSTHAIIHCHRWTFVIKLLGYLGFFHQITKGSADRHGLSSRPAQSLGSSQRVFACFTQQFLAFKLLRSSVFTTARLQKCRTSLTPTTATTLAVVTVTASGEPVTNSPPGTFTVEPSGSEASSDIPVTGQSKSRGLPSASRPGDITVTVPGQPGTPSSPGTITIQPSDSSGNPTDTTKSPAQSSISSTYRAARHGHQLYECLTFFPACLSIWLTVERVNYHD
ncbi:hypothetical protein B0T19DRAFT_467613 [Cercophora scortea]|uniref:Uncharacterized protein n=1 Tax=Cercophora scortea TaxID=314031 RepID=A0AAE0M5A7_9PEZI|nr:hypothetical protein B0T19DRAFT_467613 [Cercophora scortea]